MRTQEPEGESFVFAQKSQQQVLRLYVRRTELTGLVARKEDDAPCFLRVPFKHEASQAEHVRYDALAQKHIDAWDDRDKRLVSYAVQQERDRLAK
jgi:hypothetical protein